MTSIFEELAAALSSKRVKRDRSTSVLCIRCIQNFHASREDFSLICAGKVEHLPHKCRLFCSARISVNKVRKTSVQFVFASLLFLPKKHNRFTTGCTHRPITQQLLNCLLSGKICIQYSLKSRAQSPKKGIKKRPTFGEENWTTLKKTYHTKLLLAKV